MSGSSGSMVDSNDGVDSSLEDQFSTVTFQTVSSCVQEVNQQETKKEKSDRHLRNMIGWYVLKEVGKYGNHGLEGVVESYDNKTETFQVLYENGKSEAVSHSQLMKLKPLPPEKAPPMGTRPLMMRADNHVPRQPRRSSKGKKRARARKAPAQQSGSSSAARGLIAADSGNDGVNKRARVQNASGSTAARQSQKSQVQHSSKNN